MEQEKIAERLVILETNQKNMRDDISELKDSYKETNKIISKLSEAIVRVEGKIDSLSEDMKDIEEVQNAGKINIMKDVIKPVLISVLSSGAVLAAYFGIQG